jgi:hypothetical protein
MKKNKENKGPENQAVWETKSGIYDFSDLLFIQNLKNPTSSVASMQTLDELLERDKQREDDGFPRRIRIGKVTKPGPGKKDFVVIVPTTTEPKLYHHSPSDEEETGGSGSGDEGEVIGESPAQPEQGEGDGSGPGQGDDSGHDITSQAYDLGRILTQQFQLPNLKDKGKKRSFTKFSYDLTDRHSGYGQVLDKKATLQKVIKTNILLGNIDGHEPVDTTGLLVSPQDSIYRILSKEIDYENQAIVFFIRDYSGSMQGAPSEVINTQHLFIYSWLMYQYKNNVESRFILHDSKAKEVPDFYTYHNSQVAGGTNVYPAFQLVNKLITEEMLYRDNNIYIFYGTDGDDWEEDGKQALEEINKLLGFANRIGITIARNSWSLSNMTTVERYIDNSKLLKDKPALIRMNVIEAENSDDKRIIEGIKALIS